MDTSLGTAGGQQQQQQQTYDQHADKTQILLYLVAMAMQAQQPTQVPPQLVDRNPPLTFKHTAWAPSSLPHFQSHRKETPHTWVRSRCPELPRVMRCRG